MDSQPTAGPQTPAPIFRLAHISDLHFGRVNRDVVKALLADLRDATPDLIVASGDFTQRGRRREFRAARRFLDRLPAEWIAIPGNHDLPTFNLIERVVDPFGRYKRHIAADLCPVWHGDHAVIVCMNTARSFGPHWNWAHGRLSRRQIRDAAAILRRVPDDKLRIVVTHHPFIAPASNPGRRLVGRAGRAVRAFAAAGVDLLLAGHNHLSYTGKVGGTQLGEPRAILVVQAATATSSRLRGEVNAYNLMDFDRTQLTLNTRVWTGERFDDGITEQFRRQGGRWLAGDLLADRGHLEDAVRAAAAAHED